ncbi:MAG TPA: zf-HC2 domain-containing protein [Blastocatellia bacterium]|nr:zf-HC2 domain-containing protein [Blastocatellia bacterium]
MNVISFDNRNCKKIRTYLDSYTNNDLPDETRDEVSNHLKACAACSREMDARLRMKNLLQNAVKRDAAPAELRERVQREVRKNRTVTARRYWAAAAAMFALLLSGWAVVRLLQAPAPSNPAYQASFDPAGAQVLRVGLDNHVFCAVDHGLAHRRFSPEEMSSRLGPEYFGLVSIVERHMPGRYEVAVGHRCRANKREYVHLILKRGQEAISLVITKKNGESFERAGLPAVLNASGVPLYGTRLDGYEVAGFESRDHLAFVISDLSGEDNNRVASTLAAGVRDYLARLEAQPAEVG